MGRSGIGLGLAGVAMIASGAARAQGTATAQDAARYQGQIGAWIASLPWPPGKPPPKGLVTVAPKGDGYAFAVSMPSGAATGFDGTREPDGTWRLASGTAGPFTRSGVTERLGPSKATEKVATTFSMQEGNWTATLDPNFAQPSRLDAATKGVSVAVAKQSGPISVTIAGGTSRYDLVPGADGRMTLTATGDVEGYKVSTVTPDGIPIEITMGKANATFGATDVSPATLRSIVATLEALPPTKQAPSPTAPPRPGVKPPARPPGAPDPLLSIAPMLPDLLTGVSFAETATDQEFGYAGLSAKVGVTTVSFDSRAVGDDVGMRVEVEAKGVAVPREALGTMAALAPRSLRVPFAIEGMPATLLATMTRQGKGGDEWLRGLLNTGRVRASMDGVAIELEDASVVGTGSIAFASESTFSGSARVEATGMDALQATLAGDPSMAKASAGMAFAKGLGRQEGGKMVWDLRFDQTKFEVNGQDLTAMMGSAERR